MEKKDTVTSCLDSEEQHMQQLQMQASSQKEMCMKWFIALQGNTIFLLREDFISINSIHEDLEKIKAAVKRCSDQSVNALNVDSVVMEDKCYGKETSSSDTTCSKLVKESSLDSKIKDVHAIKNRMSKEKERCMAYFKSLHSQIQVLSSEDLKGTRIEHGFKRAFMSLFGQDVETFTSTMFLYVDQLEKQLDKDEFQEDGSIASFWLLNRQCQQFIYLQFSLDYDSQMTNKYFLEYTRIEAKDFRDTLLQHMSSVKMSIAERTHHRRQYDKRVNITQM
ncbi:hypothetical protein Tco_1291967 [Tanacetum coccineum]